MRKLTLSITLAFLAFGLTTSVASANFLPLKKAQHRNLIAMINTAKSEQRSQKVAVAAIDASIVETQLKNILIRDQNQDPVISGIFGLIPGAWGLTSQQELDVATISHAFYERASNILKKHPDLSAAEVATRVMELEAYYPEIFKDCNPLATRLYLNHVG